MKKLLILVSSGGIDPWLRIEKKGQEPALRKLMGDDSEIVWISGDPNFPRSESLAVFEKALLAIIELRSQPGSFVSRLRRIFWSMRKLSGHDIERLRNLLGDTAGTSARAANGRTTLPLPIDWGFSGFRTVENFRYVLSEFEFDYLLRITSTCLVNPVALRNFVSSLPGEKVVAGRLRRFGLRFFYSGAAVLLSRDVVQNVVAFEHLYPLDVWEDVALGTIIRRLGLAEFRSLPRIDIAEEREVLSLDDATLDKAVILRCKTEQSGTRPDSVIPVMAALTRRLSGSFDGA